MNLVLLCIISAVFGAVLEYIHINKNRIMINRPRYQHFDFAYFYVSNRRKPSHEIEDGSIDDLKKLVDELHYDFSSESYKVCQSNRLGELLTLVHTHYFKLSEEELRSIVKKLDSYMGIKRGDVLDILEIEAILKEKNEIIREKK